MMVNNLQIYFSRTVVCETFGEDNYWVVLCHILRTVIPLGVL